MKTAVLCHGYHLQAENWEEVVWGEPLSGKLGRASMAILVALDLEATTLYIGSGSSKDENGRLEAMAILNYCRERISELEQYSFGISLQHWLEERAQPVLAARDEKEEIEGVAYLCAAEGVDRMVLCSSPSRTVACLRQALRIFSQVPEVHYLKYNLELVCSHV